MSKPTAWDKVITILNEEMAQVEADRGVESAAYKALERVLIRAQLRRTEGRDGAAPGAHSAGPVG